MNEELSFSERTARLVEQIEVKYVTLNSTSLTVEWTPYFSCSRKQLSSMFCALSDTLNVDGELFRKRMERSVVDHDVSHESMMVNEADMDFRIQGLRHSFVKYAQSTSVRQLIQKID